MREADRIAEALAERPGGRLDARRMAVFGMAGGLAAELAEVLQLIERHVGIAGQMQQRIEQHRAVAGREDEAVAVGPVRLRGVELQELREQDGGDVGHAHGHAGMAGVRLLYGVHGEGPDGVCHVAVGGGLFGHNVCAPYGFWGRRATCRPHFGASMRKTSREANILRQALLHRAKMLTAPGRSTYPHGMEQMQPGDQLPSAGGGAMSKAASATDRVDDALSRLELMVEERLRAESVRSEELAKRLNKLEQQHDELKKVAMDVEGRLERAMEYIRSLLAADQE